MFDISILVCCRRTLEVCARADKPIVVLTTYETFRNSCQELIRAPHLSVFNSSCIFTKMELEATKQIEVDRSGEIEEDELAGESCGMIQ